MAQLAFEGHETRGREIIKVLEMLGGENNNHYTGTCINRIYFINGNGYIDSYRINSFNYNFQIFILEEFLKKFPYKVGDKVKCWINGYCSINNIEDMRWDRITNEIKYKILDYFYSSMNIEPYKEENMEEKRKYTELRLDPDQDDKLSTEVTCDDFKITAPDSYLIGKVTKVDNGMLVEYVKKQSKYPKTYCECCDIIQVEFIYELKNLTKDETKLMDSFISLKRCRDAYWKIAGEEMGLGKPWKPDWTDNHQKKWTINFYQGEVNLTKGPNVHFILAFPTEEMRDAFFENFKDLIESCKELL